MFLTNKNNIKNLIFGCFNTIAIIIILIIVSLFIGSRDESIGTDTKSYIRFYNIILANDHSRISELFFIFIAKSSAFLSLEHSGFLSLVSFISITTYFYFIFKIANFLNFELLYKKWIFIITTLLLTFLSLFFWNTQINVIRSGLSIPFLFLALYFFLLNKKLKFIFFYSLAIFSHLSMLMFLPFLLLKYLKESNILLIYVFLSLLYLFGINEILFNILANQFYQLEFLQYYLDNATRENSYNAGVRFDFFIFTTFFYIILVYLKKRYMKVSLLFKMYSILFFPFLILGFINYSDRLLLTAWNMIPIIIATLLLLKVKAYKQYYLVMIFLMLLILISSLYVVKLI